MKKNDSKTVVITGGASGLGLALASTYSKNGWSVVIADVDKDKGEKVTHDLSKKGRDILFLECDVRNDNDVRSLHLACVNRWEKIDLLINNAGVISTLGATDHSSIDEWQRVIDINLLGVVRGCKAFIPTFKAQESGHIVNIASIAGLNSLPGFANYNASKAAVISLSETLRLELKKRNIGVTVVCPSIFKTNLANSIKDPVDDHIEKINKIMERSSISASDISDQIYKAVNKNKFFLLPHKHTWLIWWLKRFSLRLYELILSKWPIS